jgi:Bacterial Ig domain
MIVRTYIAERTKERHLAERKIYASSKFSVPDDKGGGPTLPVVSDVYFEQTVSPIAEDQHAFRVQYKVTHLGSDEHWYYSHEVPATYPKSPLLNRFISYTEDAPWTMDAITTLDPIGEHQFLYNSELWGAFVDSQNTGLTMYLPRQYPYWAVSDLAWASVNYMRGGAPFLLPPYGTWQGEFYVIAGDYATARQTIYDLEKEALPPDTFGPILSVDFNESKPVSGGVTIYGWTYDSIGISKVEVFVDNSLAGTAEYGTSRPDVAAAYKDAPLECGFDYLLDTTKYSNGTHTLSVRGTDNADNVSPSKVIPITIAN